MEDDRKSGIVFSKQDSHATGNPNYLKKDDLTSMGEWIKSIQKGQASLSLNGKQPQISIQSWNKDVRSDKLCSSTTLSVQLFNFLT